MNLKEELKKAIKGECVDDAKTLDIHSRDASLLEVTPRLVVFPKDSADLQALVKFVNENRAQDPTLSITMRAAGSCMSGGSLNESIIADVSKNMQGVLSIDVESGAKDGVFGNHVRGGSARILPGTFYRDFEPKTLEKGLILPCFTASKNLCALGGMIANNAAGEKTLRYGKMEDFVQELRVIFADGKEYTVKPLTQSELDKKMAQGDYEGNIYKNIFSLITENREKISSAKPKVSKNSAGYYLWNVWDEKAGIFDLTKLIVGSQGTLGIVTEAKLGLVPVEKYSKLFVVFMRDLKNLGNLVREVLELNPETVESYDDSTMKLAIRFLPEMLRSMKTGSFFKLIFSFIPEAFMMLTGGIPKLILLVEFSGNDEKKIDEKMKALRLKIAHFKFKMRATKSMSESEKYWTIRRESFNLLRKHVRGMRTAPFIDDVVVRPEFLPEFLPKMRAILDRYKLIYTIAGHAGNGNFHIIPLMDMTKKENHDLIPIVSEEIFDLVKSYEGSFTGEHNDGIIRTPYLEKMFGPEITALFQKTKDIFDPQNIFNPGKKVGGSTDYMMAHLANK
ncbi:MAG: FAD-binding oxidoreductase [Candidatus Paceibacterota bacterium]